MGCWPRNQFTVKLNVLALEERMIFHKNPIKFNMSILSIPGQSMRILLLDHVMLGPNMAKTFDFSDSHATHQQAAMLPALEAPVAVLAHLRHLQCRNLHSLLSINSISNIVESIIIGIGYDIILL